MVAQTTLESTPGAVQQPRATSTVAGFARRLPVGFFAVLLTWMLMLPIGIFGVGQIATTTFRQLSGPAEMVDFVAFYTGVRLLLTDPSHLYDLGAWLRLQTLMHAGAELPLQFWNPPHTALLIAPLAMLPFGVAYLVWLLINLACLVGACYLLAPGATRTRGWLRWALVLPLFLPVQLGLIMGQLSFALLLGFAVFVRLADRPGAVRHMAALLAWTTKPQLLPVLVMSLVFMRRWRTLVLLGGVSLLLTVPVVLVAGPSVILDYVELARGAGSGVLSAEGTHLDSGHSILGLAQWLFGPGWAATGVTVLGTLGVWLLFSDMWRAGLHADPRRHLQLGLLPLAAVVSSPHALAYDAVTWLASAWLLSTFAAEVPRARRMVVVMLLVGWWGGNLAAFPQVNAIAPWGAFSALVSLVGMAWLYRQATLPRCPMKSNPPLRLVDGVAQHADAADLHFNHVAVLTRSGMCSTVCHWLYSVSRSALMSCHTAMRAFPRRVMLLLPSHVVIEPHPLPKPARRESARRFSR